MAFRKKFAPRRKFCRFCADAELALDYKRPDILRDFITERGKIVPPHYRYLRQASARPHHRDQARPPDGPAVLHFRSFQRTQEEDQHLTA